MLDEARPYPARDFFDDPTRTGFLVVAPYGDSVAVPAWAERGMAELEEVFATEADAQAAIDEMREVWGDGIRPSRDYLHHRTF